MGRDMRARVASLPAVPLRTLPAVDAPPAGVLAEFGVDEVPTPLPGGRGTAWAVRDLVLKPLDMTLDAMAWQEDLLTRIDGDGHLRVAPPSRSLRGALVVDGWTAWRRVAGLHQPRWQAVIAAGERLHHLLAGEARPAFLDRRDDPWSVADRVAWGEATLADSDAVPHLARLLGCARPADRDGDQLVHGDLTGNVLFAPGQPPAVIDLSPYWRPPGYAYAVVVADALVWEGAEETLLASVSHVGGLGRYLTRALVFRLVTSHIAGDLDPVTAGRHAHAVDLACRLAASAD